MNIWDSVHRGLEKASQEAGRIAKTQRLRSIIDGIQRQIQTQHETLISKTWELFTSGQLTQNELLSICQELLLLKQQLELTQIELKTLQQGTPSSPAASTGPYSAAAPAEPFTASNENAAVPPPPPGYQPYGGNTLPPPPPPGVEFFGETESKTDPGSPHASLSLTEEKLLCSTCQVELIPGNAYCHNCGMPIRNNDATHLPTVRAGTQEFNKLAEQQTFIANKAPAQSQNEIRGAEQSPSTPNPTPTNTQDGGS